MSRQLFPPPPTIDKFLAVTLTQIRPLPLLTEPREIIILSQMGLNVVICFFSCKYFAYHGLCVPAGRLDRGEGMGPEETLKNARKIQS
jgi:hypothetical protein